MSANLRLSGWVRVWAVALALAVGWAPAAAAARGETGRGVAQALGAVVLVLREAPDGTVNYGAGALVGDGLVITNRHVALDGGALSVLLYDPERTTYAPTDGGLPRFLFENGRDLRPARLVRSDGVLDLALLEVEGGTTGWPTLKMRDRPVSVGERVVALGHPKEAVWSFTAGVVSATPQGLIQHDAAINTGNSGGPLVDARGRFVGVNTLKVVGGAEGLAFARPAPLVVAMLPGGAPASIVDLSTPERAFLSCEHAAELAQDAVLDCIDWAFEAESWPAVVDDAMSVLALPAPVAARVRAAVLAGGPAAWLNAVQHGVAGIVLGAPWSPVVRVSPETFAAAWPDPAERARLAADDAVLASLARARDALLAAASAEQARLASENGLTADIFREPGAFREIRRMGLRVDAIAPVGQTGAVIAVAGRNVDGQPLQYTECWAWRTDRWLQHLHCSDEDLAALPEGWPGPVAGTSQQRRNSAYKLAIDILGITRDEAWGALSAEACGSPVEPKAELPGVIKAVQ